MDDMQWIMHTGDHIYTTQGMLGLAYDLGATGKTFKQSHDTISGIV
jgi:hypothetical protein